MAHNVVLCRLMAAFSASLRPGRRTAGSMRGRSVDAEPLTGGVVCGVDARVLAGERGLGGGLHTCMCTLPESSFEVWNMNTKTCCRNPMTLVGV